MAMWGCSNSSMPLFLLLFFFYNLLNVYWWWLCIICQCFPLSHVFCLSVMNCSLWWLWSAGLQIQEPHQLENQLFIQLLWTWEAKHMSKIFLSCCMMHVCICLYSVYWIVDLTRDFIYKSWYTGFYKSIPR